MKINYKNESLFKNIKSVEGAKVLYVQCISADLAMGAGIALEFNKYFNTKNVLKKYMDVNKICVGDITSYKHTNNIGVVCLITKQKYSGKPTYDSISKCLNGIKAIIETKKETNYIIRMPFIGCGLDKLNWDNVSQIINDIFEDTTNCSIEVYTNKEKGKSMTNKPLPTQEKPIEVKSARHFYNLAINPETRNLENKFLITKNSFKDISEVMSVHDNIKNANYKINIVTQDGVLDARARLLSIKDMCKYYTNVPVVATTSKQLIKFAKLGVKEIIYADAAKRRNKDYYIIYDAIMSYSVTVRGVDYDKMVKVVKNVRKYGLQIPVVDAISVEFEANKTKKYQYVIKPEHNKKKDITEIFEKYGRIELILHTYDFEDADYAERLYMGIWDWIKHKYNITKIKKPMLNYITNTLKNIRNITCNRIEQEFTKSVSFEEASGDYVSSFDNFYSTITEKKEGEKVTLGADAYKTIRYTDYVPIDPTYVVNLKCEKEFEQEVLEEVRTPKFLKKIKGLKVQVNGGEVFTFKKKERPVEEDTGYEIMCSTSEMLDVVSNYYDLIGFVHLDKIYKYIRKENATLGDKLHYVKLNNNKILAMLDYISVLDDIDSYVKVDKLKSAYIDLLEDEEYDRNTIVYFGNEIYFEAELFDYLGEDDEEDDEEDEFDEDDYEEDDDEDDEE